MLSSSYSSFCSICEERMKLQDEKIILKCHQFHFSCYITCALVEDKLNFSKCVFCQKDVKVKFYEYEQDICIKKYEEACSICHEELGIETECKKLDCNHIFHNYCINRWSEINNTCPLCRKSNVERNRERDRIPEELEVEERSNPEMELDLILRRPPLISHSTRFGMFNIPLIQSSSLAAVGRRIRNSPIELLDDIEVDLARQSSILPEIGITIMTTPIAIPLNQDELAEDIVEENDNEVDDI